MNILVLDFWFGKTHQRLNKRTIEILRRNNNVLATTYGGYYDSFTDDGKIQLINVKCRNRKTNKLFQRIQSVYNIIEAKKAVKNCSYDAILVTGYEVISVIVATWIFGTQCPLFLQYHQHIDQVVQGLKRRVFDMYKNRVHHVFLEEEYAEYFIKMTGVTKERVHVVHHPLLGEVIESGRSEGKDILGISSSNDDMLVEKIIELEKQEQKLEQYGCKMELRSAKSKYEGDKLCVDCSFLSAEEYEEKFNNAGTILVIPKKEEFIHRVSGTIYDAISAGKKVVGVDISIMRIMKSLAPSMFYTINENDNILERICELSILPIKESDVCKVRERHSDIALAKEYEDCFKELLIR